jgi:hypothetical protein
MPVMLFWAIPASIIVGGVGYYLITIAVWMPLLLFRLRSRRIGDETSS